MPGMSGSGVEAKGTESVSSGESSRDADATSIAGVENLEGIGWSKLATPVVLLSAVLLGYNWPTLPNQTEQWGARNFLPSEIVNAVETNQSASAIYPEGKLNNLESGSDIYREYIGSSPYEQSSGSRVQISGPEAPQIGAARGLGGRIIKRIRNWKLVQRYIEYIGKNPY